MHMGRELRPGFFPHSGPGNQVTTHWPLALPRPSLPSHGIQDTCLCWEGNSSSLCICLSPGFANRSPMDQTTVGPHGNTWDQSDCSPRPLAISEALLWVQASEIYLNRRRMPFVLFKVKTILSFREGRRYFFSWNDFSTPCLEPRGGTRWLSETLCS